MFAPQPLDAKTLKIPPVVAYACPRAVSLDAYLWEHFSASPPTSSSLAVTAICNESFAALLRDSYVSPSQAWNHPPARAGEAPSEGEAGGPLAFANFASAIAARFLERQSNFSNGSSNLLGVAASESFRERSLLAKGASDTQMVVQGNRLWSHFLVEKAWDLLLRIVGAAFVTHLLGECTILIRTSRGPFLQISGPPIADRAFLSLPPRRGVPPARQLKALPAIAKKVLPRHRIFYGTPIRGHGGAHHSSSLPHAFIVGLPPNNRLNKARRVDDGLVEHIFYREATISPSTKRSLNWRALHGACRRLLDRHHKCPYRALYEYHCVNMYTSILGGGLGFYTHGQNENDRAQQAGCIEGAPEASKDYNVRSLWMNQQPYRRVASWLKAILHRLLCPGDSDHAQRSFRSLVKSMPLVTVPLCSLQSSLVVVSMLLQHVTYAIPSTLYRGRGFYPVTPPRDDGSKGDLEWPLHPRPLGLARRRA